MEHIAELVGVTPAEVLGTCSFYEMFKREPVGTYLVNVCTNISCLLLGGEELLEHAEETLGVKAGRHHRRRPVHARGRRVHRRLHRGAVPPGQLPLLPPAHPRRVRPARRRPPRRPPRRRDPAPRHAGPGPPAHPRPTGPPGRRCPTSGAEPVWIASRPAPPPPKERADRDRHRRPEDRHVAVRARRRAHARRATTRPAATRACGRALDAAARRRSSSEVKTASLLGRGGAGFPAGVKWGFCPPGVWPRYLVVNGDESEPGTYKDRLLMERDPHQLIEGVLIACYAVGLRAGLPLRPGRDGPGPGADRRGPQRGLRRRLRRREHPRLRLLGRHRPALGRRRLHRRRGDRAHREPRGQPGHAPAQAAVLPGGQGPVPAADDRQQRRDAGQPAVDRAQRRRRVRRARRRGEPGHPHVRGVRPREEARRLRGRVRRHHLPRPALRARCTAAASATATSSRRSSPAARRRLVLRGAPRPAARGRRRRQGRLDARLRRDRRHGRDHRHGQGRAAGRALLRPRVVRQVHACREGTSWLEKILAAHPRRPRPARATSTCCSTSATTSARGIAWPPRQTTICPLGPSAVSPIASAVDALPRRVRGLHRRARAASTVPGRAAPLQPRPPRRSTA